MVLDGIPFDELMTEMVLRLRGFERGWVHFPKFLNLQHGARQFISNAWIRALTS